MCDPQNALTPDLFQELSFLDRNRPNVLKYEELTKKIDIELNARNDIEKAQKLRAERQAMSFTPPADLKNGEDLLSRYNTLKDKIRIRFEECLTGLHFGEYIDFAVFCLEYTQNIEKTLKSEDLLAAAKTVNLRHLVNTKRVELVRFSV
jgi:hypothetical protein